MPEKQSKLSKFNPSDIYGIAALVIVVLAATVLTMGYFLFLKSSKKPPVVAQVEQSDAPATAAPKPASDADVDDDEDYDEDDEDYDDWVDEPIYVVNEIDLPDEAATKALFERNCMSCHGEQGKGDGVAAKYLIPRPRDFVTSPYRFAAEWADEYHIVADLERTIRDGVPRSAMPAFGGVLSEKEIAGLANHVFGMRDPEKVTAAVEQVDVGARPPLTIELVNRGKELFTKLACTTCHGETGAGNGTLAMSLVDFQQNPVRPADFTSGLFKSGQRAEDLVRSILRGVPGTPMVSYEGILLVENEDSDEESYNTIDAWALAAYIRTLAPRVSPPGTPSGFNIQALPALDPAMLNDPVNPAWFGVKAASLRVNPLQTRHDELDHVDIRAVRSTDQIAILVEWNDSTFNPLSDSDDRHPDGMAIMFGLEESPSAVQVTSVESENTQPAINEWRWGADKQYQCADGDSTTESIDYNLLTAWPLLVLSPQSSTPASGGAAKVMDGPECAVIESNGLVAQSAAQQGAIASAAWIDGVWRVIVTRDLKTDDSADVQFSDDLRIPISISIWNGAEGNRIDAMSVSSWHWLTLTE